MAAGSEKPKTCALKLVRPVAVAPEPPAPSVSGQPAAPAPRSNLGRFLTAYADAIDRDIKVLLEL